MHLKIALQQALHPYPNHKKVLKLQHLKFLKILQKWTEVPLEISKYY